MDPRSSLRPNHYLPRQAIESVVSRETMNSRVRLRRLASVKNGFHRSDRSNPASALGRKDDDVAMRLDTLRLRDESGCRYLVVHNFTLKCRHIRQS